MKRPHFDRSPCPMHGVSAMHAITLSSPLIALAASSSSLHLTGDDSSIRFGDGAVLQARCHSLDASVRYLRPTSTSVRAVFQGVPRTCTGVALAVPCSSQDPFYPRLFHCAWTPTTGAADQSAGARVGPLRALSEKEVDPDGEVLGYNVFVECPLPPADELLHTLATSTSVAAPLTLNFTLTVTHSAAPGDERLIPNAGAANEVAVELVDGVPRVAGASVASQPEGSTYSMVCR